MEYTVQYDLVASDTNGNPLQVCFHASGQVGFHCPEEANAAKALLDEANRKMGRIVSYEVRPILVSNAWSGNEIVFVETEDDDEPHSVTDLVLAPALKGSN